MGGITSALRVPPLPPPPEGGGVHVPTQAEIIQIILNRSRGTSPDGGIGPGSGTGQPRWRPTDPAAQDWRAHGGTEAGWLAHQQGQVNGPRRVGPAPPGSLAGLLGSHYNANSGLEDIPNTPGTADRRLGRWINRGKVGSIDETGVTRVGKGQRKITFDETMDPESVAGLTNLNMLRGGVRTAVGAPAKLAAKQAFGQAAVDYGQANKPPEQQQFETMLRGLGMGGMT